MRRTAFLGLLALFLHVATPLFAQVAQQPAATIELCTVHGVVSIPDPGHAPPPTAPAAEHCDLCAWQGMAAPSLAAASAAAMPQRERTAPRHQSLTPALPTTASRPRAPPLPV